MGAYGIPGETGTHAEIDRELMRSWDRGDGTVCEHTDCKLVGFNHHWSVYRENGKPIEIQLAIISRYRESRDRAAEWVYRPMGETSGPYVYDCPLALLDMVPEPEGSEWAHNWREGVRQYHAAKAATSTRGLAVGDVVTLKDGLRLFGQSIGGQAFTVKGFHGRTPYTYVSGYTVKLKRTQIASFRKGA